MAKVHILSLKMSSRSIKKHLIDTDFNFFNLKNALKSEI